MKSLRLILILTCLFQSLLLFSQNKTNVYDGTLKQLENISILLDHTHSLTIDDIIKKNFTLTGLDNPGITKSVIWAKINITNLSNEEGLELLIKNPLLDDVSIYAYANNQISDSVRLGHFKPFHKRFVDVPNFIYPIKIAINGNVDIYLRISSISPMHLPMFIGNSKQVEKDSRNEFLIIGLFCGILFIMFFYNLFLLLTTRDRSYLYYIIYIVAVGIAQLDLTGYAFKFLWPNDTWLSVNSLNISGIFSGIATALFSQSFLKTKKQYIALHRIFNLLIAAYCVSLLLHFFGYSFIALNIINLIAAIGSAFAIYAGIHLMRENYEPAKFFLVAFSVFLLAVIIYVLRTTNIIPYNNFTAYILEIGAAMQIMLLSLALANKINTYRRERSIARNKALEMAKENERLVREQNIHLEKEVKVRTAELQQANTDLKETLKQLKMAQAKLVDSEKMASLGQLTAGVAHEINNPINFVASNVKPLELDINDIFEVLNRYENIDPNNDIASQLQSIDDFKNEIDVPYIAEEIRSLLAGIKEGAQRTADIVKNLKNFVRLDQSNLVQANLNEGIESTLVLIRNTFPQNLVIKKELGDIGKIECSPGKINQVFMNIISNAVQAIRDKDYSNGEVPTLSLRTTTNGKDVHITIKDNGIGMSDEVLKKIYEPFFTTKDVGEGTGLGMSIVKGIIDSHNGSLTVHSKPGKGSEFIIALPVQSPLK